MIIAEMWTESRTWISRGKTIRGAKEALRRAWNTEQERLKKDRKRYGFDHIPVICKTVSDLENLYDISIYDLTASDVVII